MNAPTYREATHLTGDGWVPLPGVVACDHCGCAVLAEQTGRHTRWHADHAQRVQLLHPEAGDVILLTVEPGQRITPDRAMYLKDEYRRRFPHNEVIVNAGFDVTLARSAP